MQCNAIYDEETHEFSRCLTMYTYMYTCIRGISIWIYMFMQNVKILLTAVKCLSCVKLLLCMICIQSLLQAQTLTHILRYNPIIYYSLSLFLSYPALKIHSEQMRKPIIWFACMHACRWFAFSLCCIFFSVSPFSRSLFRPPWYNNSHHSFGLFFSLLCCCCFLFSIWFSCTSFINKETENQIKLKILIQ